MKKTFTRISSVLLAALLLVVLVPMQAIALDNGGAGGSEAGELQWICVSGTHSWDAGVVTTAATCTGTGVRTFTCTLCGQTKTENISATGHAFGEWTVTTEATCGNPGERTRVCANDPTHVEVEVINATGEHTLVPTAAVTATCTTAGNSAYWTCSVCGKYFSDANGENAIEANSWIVPATGHTLTATEAVAATCTAAGNSAYWTCSECGKYFSDENGETEIEADSWIIPAAGHTWVAWQEGDDIADFTLKTEATTESAAVYYKNCSVDGTSAKGIDEDATFTYGDPLPDEPDIMYGDADGDGEITSLDVLLLNQYFANRATVGDLEAGADVDGDGEITSLDVLLLNQYFANRATVDDFGPQE